MTATNTAAATGASPRILIVEDEQLLQDAYRHVLTFKGYEVSTANDGLEAIKALQSFKPDIILLDVLMPRLDGFGFLQQTGIKRTRPDIKIVACTNLSDQVTVEKMLSLGADRQVLKSDLSPVQLVNLVEELAAANQSIDK